MKLTPITRALARRWLKQTFGVARIPHSAACYWVSGMEYAHPARKGLYMVAGDEGLEGIFVVQVKSVAQEQSA